MKYRWMALFSVFSLTSVILVIISLVVIFSAFIGWIDKESKAARIANEVLSNQIGLPIEEIEEFEGMKKDSK